jgi:hypothetical protein
MSKCKPYRAGSVPRAQMRLPLRRSRIEAKQIEPARPPAEWWLLYGVVVATTVAHPPSPVAPVGDAKRQRTMTAPQTVPRRDSVHTPAACRPAKTRPKKWRPAKQLALPLPEPRGASGGHKATTVNKGGAQ